MIRSHILYPIELRVRLEEGSNNDTKAGNGNSGSVGLEFGVRSLGPVVLVLVGRWPFSVRWAVRRRRDVRCPADAAVLCVVLLESLLVKGVRVAL